MPQNIHVRKGSLLLELIATPFYQLKASGKPIKLILRVLCMVLVRIIGSSNFYHILFKGQKPLPAFDIAISYFMDVPGNCFNQGTNQYVLEHVKAHRKVAWIHTDLVLAGFDPVSSANLYKRFDGIACVSQSCKEVLDNLIPDCRNLSRVVYNFQPAADIQRKAEAFQPTVCERKFNLITVGRIDNASKRLNLIPMICSQLKKWGVNNFFWRIIGDGPDRAHNMQLVEQFKVSEFVGFEGEKANPYPYIKHSDLFILISAYEGYPMVVGESLLLGVPVISTCYASAGEQIVDQHNGIITKMDPDEICAVLAHLLKNPEKIRQMKANIASAGIYTNDIGLKQFDELVGIRDEQQ